MVNDQDEAGAYTEIPGFQKKVDVPVGEFRWITFVSPEVPDGVQLVLEPNENPVGKAFQQGLHEQAFATAFTVDDVQQEYERLQGLGVQFTTPPTTQDWGTMAVFDDTVGNLIQIQDVSG